MKPILPRDACVARAGPHIGDTAFVNAVDDELQRLSDFLGL